MRALLVDAGNTRIKWAVRDTDAARGSWVSRGECPTVEARRFRQAVDAARPAGVALGLVCSVAGDAATADIESALKDAGIDAVERFRSVPRLGPLRNAYENPGQLGPDRLAAALGAWQRTGRDAIVVGAGTATTIDVLRGEGLGGAVFAGGVILPGLDLMRLALARNTAGLPLAEGQFRALPGNTDDAIASGCLHAQLGAIGRMRAQLAADAPCVIGGGAAARLMPLLDAPCVLVPDLVLEGLAAAILHGFQQ